MQRNLHSLPNFFPFLCVCDKDWYTKKNSNRQLRHGLHFPPLEPSSTPGRGKPPGSCSPNRGLRSPKGCVQGGGGQLGPAGGPRKPHPHPHPHTPFVLQAAPLRAEAAREYSCASHRSAVRAAGTKTRTISRSVLAPGKEDFGALEQPTSAV